MEIRRSFLEVTRYELPGGAAKLARPSYKQLRRCELCKKRRRIGRWWPLGNQIEVTSHQGEKTPAPSKYENMVDLCKRNL